mmetsp:Transcript_58084/g.165070  ORF Transcript_58084/g.165070 Transcript_58084/m.165070 type:complete len:117 (-) Transcript_58084:224-574(-)
MAVSIFLAALSMVCSEGMRMGQAPETPVILTHTRCSEVDANEFIPGEDWKECYVACWNNINCRGITKTGGQCWHTMESEWNPTYLGEGSGYACFDARATIAPTTTLPEVTPEAESN